MLPQVAGTCKLDFLPALQVCAAFFNEWKSSNLFVFLILKLVSLSLECTHTVWIRSLLTKLATVSKKLSIPLSKHGHFCLQKWGSITKTVAVKPNVWCNFFCFTRKQSIFSRSSTPCVCTCYTDMCVFCFGSSVPSCFLVVLFTLLQDCHMFTILIPYILPLIFPLQLSVYIQTIKLVL